MIHALIAVTAFAAPAPRLIVQLAPGASAAAVGTRAKVLLREVIPGAPFALYEVPTGTADAAQLRLQADVKNVVWAEDDVSLLSPEAVPGPFRSKGGSMSVIGDRLAVVAKNTTALTQVEWTSNLANSAGRTVRVAVLDNGLSRKQPGLWSKVDAYYDALGGNADDAPMNLDTNGNGIRDEGVGHGTMVAGIVDMVAPKVRLVIAKVADSDGQANSWNLVKGIAFAVNQKAEVANISLGSATAVAAFNDVAEWAETKGLLVVAAIGNTNTDRSWYPARSSKALCVAGVAPGDLKASFSNWDGAADACAPAVGIVSQFWDGKLGAWSGTSFASPFVAAGVADCLRRTAAPQAPRNLIRAVTESGQSVDSLNKKYKGKMGTLLSILNLNNRIVLKK